MAVAFVTYTVLAGVCSCATLTPWSLLPGSSFSSHARYRLPFKQQVLLLFLFSYHLLENLSHKVLEVSTAIVLQDDLIKLLKLLHLKVLQFVELAAREDAGECLADLTLYANGYVLLHEVLNCVELVGLLIQFSLHLVDLLPHPVLDLLHN